jgi:hypothetical protein
MLMNYLMVTENATGNGQIMNLADAAILTHIEADIIEDSVQSVGVCASIDHTIVDTEAAEDVCAA